MNDIKNNVFRASTFWRKKCYFFSKPADRFSFSSQVYNWKGTPYINVEFRKDFLNISKLAWFGLNTFFEGTVLYVLFYKHDTQVINVFEGRDVQIVFAQKCFIHAISVHV